jgi:hypothetical protein
MGVVECVGADVEPEEEVFLRVDEPEEVVIE